MNNAAAHIAHEYFKHFENDGFGMSCWFINLGKIGVKCYGCVKDAKENFRMQTEFHGRGMAPECWGFSEVGQIGAFFTETAIVLNDLFNRTSSHSDDSGWHRCLFPKVVEGTEYDCGDCHVGNYGIIPETGKLVMIDFSHHCDNESRVSKPYAMEYLFSSF
jgi:hypothetical protein